MRHTIQLLALVIAVSTVPVGRANADNVLSAEESSCQLRTSRIVLSSFSRRYAKCLLKCTQHADSRAAAAQNCTLTGACAFGIGNPTCRCLDRAILQASDGEVKACGDCPECYTSGGADPNPSCSNDADAKTSAIGSWTESLFFSGSPAVYCDDSASVDALTVPEARCQHSTAKALAAFAREKAQCYTTCRTLERGGGTPAGSCDAPVLSNPGGNIDAKTCVQRAEARAALRIDKQCGLSGENRPECYNGTSGNGWVTIEEGFIDGQDASYYCASPSPAFLDW